MTGLYLCSLEFILGTHSSHTSITEMPKVQNDFRVLRSLSTTVAVKPEKVFFPLCLKDVYSASGIEVAEVRLSMLENLFLKF